MKQQIIAQAAEAIIIKQGNKIIKRRIKKSYRLPELDNKLRKLRTRGEARLINKSPTPTPKILEVSEKNKEIIMKYIPGKKLSDHLDSLKNKNKVAEQIGKQTAKLHDANIIHSDLTTSNMILKNNQVYFIDFGLGFTSPKIEDKAVDLHLIKQALEAKHYKHHEQLFKAFLKGYNPENKKEILIRLKKVEVRGRYKH